MMKRKINIYTNKKKFLEINEILSNYEITFKNIYNLGADSSEEPGLVFLDENTDLSSVKFRKPINEYLILSNIDFEILNKKIKNSYTKTPIHVSKFINKVDRFTISKKTQTENISIYDKKIRNLKNKKSCYLTEIENEILLCLIKNKKTTKSYIKTNILNIKSNLETNSLESHLTRIRKKIEGIDAKIKIYSKQDLLILELIKE